jgi:hypothetical protein
MEDFELLMSFPLEGGHILQYLYGKELQCFALNCAMNHELLFELAYDHPFLKELTLMNCSFDQKSLNALSKMRKLETLNLAHARLDFFTITKLILAVPQLKTLKLAPKEDHYLLDFLANHRIRVEFVT